MKNKFHLILCVLLVLVIFLPSLAADSKRDKQILPANAKILQVAGHTGFLALPKDIKVGHKIPWVWYFPSDYNLPGELEQWMIKKCLANGLAVAGIDVKGDFGTPDGRSVFTAFYKELTENHGLTTKGCLLARSYGATQMYNWAAEHPESVACLAGIYPVCNLESYPGLKSAAGKYGMTEEQFVKELKQHNPIDRLALLARAKVPIYHNTGDVDKLVPAKDNSFLVEKRYKALGGDITVTVFKGQGHNYWTGFFEDEVMAEFIIKHAKKAALPKVLIFGDSVSGGYSKSLMKLLDGKAVVTKLGAVEGYRIQTEVFWHSQGTAKYLDFGSAKACIADLERFERHLSETRYDVIHFNFGLNDIFRGRNGAWFNPVDQYEKDLATIAALLKENGAKIIWSNITPIPAKAPYNPEGDELIYNAAAEKVMKKNNIPINDLHSVVTSWDGYAEWREGDDVHFSDAVYSKLAEQIARKVTAALAQSNWEKITRESKPWTRWWLMGSALSREDIRDHLIELKNAGIGGVEIVPIYGAKGYENLYVDFLSKEWMKLLEYMVNVAGNLDMGVDMTMGTGWPFGGPQVEPHFASSRLHIQSYSAEGNTVFEREMIIEDETQLGLAELQYVTTFSEKGEYTDLTPAIRGNHLKWNVPAGSHTIYAVFCAKTGQKVKRAAPGGEGYVLDHFSAEAFEDYARPFEEAFASARFLPRALFNDSYEAYGSDYSAGLFEEFKTRRGYDLKEHIPQLLHNDGSPSTNRIISDYRETFSDMIIENFAQSWQGWAESQGMQTKYQAHGSPGNLIDLYATANMPECETYGSMPFDISGYRRETGDIIPGEADIMMLKFSTSAGHIANRPRISSESLTWLREHFKGALSQAKPEAEGLLLAGVNHLFFHGSTYSPREASWPGWKFYAAVNLHPNNTIWKDAPDFFRYISRCQSMLQAGKPDNEILLYWPVYDQWGRHQEKILMQIQMSDTEHWLYPTSFYKTANRLLDQGYQTDFISEKFIEKAKVVDGEIALPGGNYKALVVPDCQFMPLKTLEKLAEMKKNGADIIFSGLPESVPGFYNYKLREAELLKFQTDNKQRLEVCDNVISELNKLTVIQEQLPAYGLKYIRRSIGNDKIYFVVNHTSNEVNSYVRLGADFKEAILLDPLTGKEGLAKTSKKGELLLKLRSGESILIRTFNRESKLENWNYPNSGREFVLSGKWKIEFLDSTPYPVESKEIDKLVSWTGFSKEAKAYSGTARYTIEFDKPETKSDVWNLKLGDVRESARIWLNGIYMGCAWANPFEMNIGPLKEGKNRLEIEVTNLAANRIRELEKSGKEWKVFNNINMVNKDYKKFDATSWEPVPSGLMGPVKLESVYYE
ncbi:MAG: hypothetical protein GY790_24165 [Bacteroidetes bacterium]|nr:hypothetical protein [Bacteroidota bacterium]